MKVREAMSTQVQLVSPDQPISHAAKLMSQGDLGALPVGSQDRLIGMITDRDIAVRAVATGLGPDTPIRKVMSHELKYCFEDDEVDEVADNMGEIQVRRLPVVNREKRLVGIISTADIAGCVDAGRVGQTVAGISTAGGSHCQALN